MKVLHCIPSMGGGGAERQLAYLAGALIARGWDVHAALEASGPNFARLRTSGAAIHRLTGVTSYDPRLAWQLAKIVRSIKPDLIQAWFVQMEVIAGAVSTLLGLPWILSERSSSLAYPKGWKSRVRIATARRADAIISNSSGGDDYWKPRVGAGVPRFVIPNALPLEEIDAEWAQLPAGLPICPEQTVIVSIGRFAPEKNIDRVFDALRDVVRRPRTVAILCGDGPLRPAICQRIAEQALSDRMFAPGYVTEIWPLLKRADVVIAAGIFEGRPNAAIEAMAAGRPLVVSDIPAHREILDARSALWVDPFDTHAIANGVRRILDDPASAEQRTAVARSRAANWSTAAVAAEYDSVYKFVLARRVAAARHTVELPRP